MKSRRSLLPVFFLFILLALAVFGISFTPVGKAITGTFEQLLLPVQKSLFATIGYGSRAATPEEKLREENIKLQTALAKQDDLIKEINALRDQFKTTEPSPKQLLPAQVVGGANDEFILDKGSADGIKAGNILISKDNLVGTVTKVSVHRSIGQLITKNNATFTAKTAKTSALGIIQGKGEERLLFANVVLADKLEKNDIVMTKGDEDETGKGFPPDLIVGKIVAVNKKPSNLFQSAVVEPLIDFGKLETVFVIVN